MPNLSHRSSPLFSAFASQIKTRLHSHDDFNTQGLSNTVWAFAKAGHLDEALFKALAGAIQRRLSDFNSQDLANAAWAFAKACHPDDALFAALARCSQERLHEFNIQVRCSELRGGD